MILATGAVLVPVVVLVAQLLLFHMMLGKDCKSSTSLIAADCMVPESI
jgi:hypothetical protein